jgi:uncharacterized sporulation protein YeaH/YhbH (DUF444 family)
MVLNIEQDYLRFRQIVRGKIKQDLKKYISQGELIGKRERTTSAFPSLRLRCRTSASAAETPVASARAKAIRNGARSGDVMKTAKVRPAMRRRAHPRSGSHDGGARADPREELELPRIQPKGTARINTERDKYSQISKVGPESLRHFKRTYKEALKRQITAAPTIRRTRTSFRSTKTNDISPGKQRTAGKQCAHHVHDGRFRSMGDEQKEIVRIESFWIDTWIQTNYNGCHDAIHHP